MLVLNVYCQPTVSLSAILLGSRFAYNAYKLNYLKDIFACEWPERNYVHIYVEQKKTIIIINCEWRTIRDI